MKAKFYLEIEQEINDIDGNLTTSENVEQALMNLLSIINNPVRNKAVDFFITTSFPDE